MESNTYFDRLKHYTQYLLNKGNHIGQTLQVPNKVTIVLIVITVVFIILLIMLKYVQYVYKSASEGLIEMADEIDTPAISFSFMIPQMFSDVYVSQVIETIKHIEEVEQERVYLVLRVKSLGKSKQEQTTNFRHILELVAQARRYTDKRLFVILAGLFAPYNELEYDLYNEALDQGFPDILITIQGNRSVSESKIDSILKRQGCIRLVKGYYKGDITDRELIHVNYMKLARKLIQSGGYHIIGTHNLDKIQELTQEFPQMHEHISLAYLYYINEYYQNQLELHPDIASRFDIIPQIQTSELSTLSVIPYTLDAIREWNYKLMFNLMGVNKYLPKYENMPY